MISKHERPWAVVAHCIDRSKENTMRETWYVLCVSPTQEYAKMVYDRMAEEMEQRKEKLEQEKREAILYCKPCDSLDFITFGGINVMDDTVSLNFGRYVAKRESVVYEVGRGREGTE